MATEILMPKLGMTMEEGTVVEWLKKEGEWVEKDEPIVIISSDKAEIEVESPDSGLLTIVVHEGNVVSVSEVIGLVRAEGEVVESKKETKTQDAKEGEVVDNNKEFENQHFTKSEKRIRISPSARKLAKKEGIDITKIQGTGPGNRITREDILRAIADRKERESTVESDFEFQNNAREHVREITVTGIRKIIAERMYQSLQQSAQLTLHTEVDATELVQLRRQINKHIFQHLDVDITYNDLIARATILTLKNHPNLNAKWENQKIVQYGPVHLGIALHTERGLLVPVVRNAQGKSLIQLSREIKTLVTKGKEGKLSVDELKGSTFTITNLGSYGIDEFTPILNPPEVGILGIGRLIERPAVYNGEITIRTMMKLSLTFDHRVLDGAPAAEFLRELTSYIENPYRLIFFDNGDECFAVK